MASPKSITIGNVRLTLKHDREWGEWQVRVYVNGKFRDLPTYYGGSGAEGKEDAIIVMKHMAERILKGTLDLWAPY